MHSNPNLGRLLARLSLGEKKAVPTLALLYVTIRVVVPYVLVTNNKSEDVVLLFIRVVLTMTRTLLTLVDRRLTLDVQTS